MCIIAVCLKRKMTPGEVHECWKTNDDGAGIAWMENDKVRVKKGFMKEDDFKAFYQEFPENIEHVAHFRTSTAHGVVPELTHPFVINTDSPNVIEYEGDDSVLFHNGIWSDWEKQTFQFFLNNGVRVPDGVWSDSRALAVICNRLGTNVLALVSGKFAIVTKTGIFVRGDYEREEGILFSNSGYKSWGRTYASDGYGEGCYRWGESKEKEGAKSWEERKTKADSLTGTPLRGGATATPYSSTKSLPDPCRASSLLGGGGRDGFPHSCGGPTGCGAGKAPRKKERPRGALDLTMLNGGEEKWPYYPREFDG